jgi:glycosyltransferase involved in cell wall biosynthesis
MLTRLDRTDPSLAMALDRPREAGLRPLRICLLSYRSNPHCGGQGVYIRHLSRALVELGHHVELVSGPPAPELDVPIPVHRLACLDLYDPANPFRLPSVGELVHPLNLYEWLSVSTMGFPEPFLFGLRAWRFLQRHGRAFDVIHDNQSLSYGVWAASRRLPVLATIHHPITVDRRIAVAAETRLWGKAKQLRWHSFLGMQQRVARRLRRIVTVSRSAQADISRDFRIPAARFSVVPNGIDTLVFHPLPGVEREPGRVIVTNSADIPLKGLAYLLQAVATVARRGPLHLVVIGQPKKNGAIERQVRELGIGAWVTFTGRVTTDALVRQYARASLAVVPSVYEGFGLPAGEAMACGVPVVSTTGGALPEVVGPDGLLVPPCNAPALAKAIGHLLDHPEEAAALGRRGYARVQQHFTWQRAAQRTVDVYRELMHDYGRL